MATPGEEHPRPGHAHIGWLHRSADADAAFGLCRSVTHDIPADAADRVATSKPRRGGWLNNDYCSPVSPLVRFLARSISVTAIRISARVFRSGASSIACFSGGPYGDIIASALTRASLGALSTPSQSTLRLLALRKSVSTSSSASRSTASSPLRAVKSSI